MKRIAPVFFVAILLVALFVPNVFAGTASGGGGGGSVIRIGNPLAPCETVDCVIWKIYGALIRLAAPIITIMVLVGAFQILTAAGNPEKVSKGRSTILYAAIGGAIILLASSVSYIVRDLLRDSPSPPLPANQPVPRSLQGPFPLNLD